MKKIFTNLLPVLALLVLFPFMLKGKEIYLMKDGKAVSAIVLNKNASDTEQHAAKELSLFLGKIADGKAPEILQKNNPALYPISFKMVENDKEIKDDGFRIAVTEKGTVISAKHHRGLLYGAYEILKRYGGIYFLLPGDDGIYYEVKKNISIPVSNKVYNPSFPIRTFFFESASFNSPLKDTYDWAVRNNMYIEATPMQYFNKRINPLLKYRAPEMRSVIHAFCYLLSMDKKTMFNSKVVMKALGEKHPEYFPLINGKRRPDLLESASGGSRAQPCTSNPEVIKLMGDNLAELFKYYGTKGYSNIVGNNDGTIWCECASCKALDGKGKMFNYPENRYWTFINTLAERVWKEVPDAKLVGWAYQDFHNPPSTVIPDKRLVVQLVFNRRCQRHTLVDPNCPINKVFLKNFTDWSKFPNRKFTWEQFNHSGAYYMPMENTFVEDLYTYKKLNVHGTMLAANPLDGYYSKKYKNTTTPYVWRNMWQTYFLCAAVLWDVNTDKNALLEKINSLYYGKAWKGGMKEFRTVLDQTARNTPGCFGHGLGSPVGRCLDQPGSHAKLLKALANAEKAAKDDPRSLAHVKMDRKLFGLTWEAKRKEYLESFRDLSTFTRTAPIKIDGKLDDADWKKANIITNFQTRKKTAPEEQTYARLTYDRDNIYIGAEMMESAFDQLLPTPDNPEHIWRSNTFEFFLNQPDLGSDYLHIMFAPNGTAYVAMRNLAGNMISKLSPGDIEYKVVKNKDRWTVECRIPASVAGMHFTNGSTWKINIGRGRYWGKRMEGSSICGGSFQGSGMFQPLLLSGTRVITSNGEKIISYWKNPALNVSKKRPAYSNWKKWDMKDNLEPDSWHPGTSKPGKGAIIRKKGSKDAYFQFTGSVSQAYRDRSDNSIKLRIRIIAAGKGKMALSIPRYKGKSKFCGPDGKMLKGKNPVILTDEFKEYTWEYTKRPGEFFALTIASSPDGEVKLDNAIITPVK